MSSDRFRIQDLAGFLPAGADGLEDLAGRVEERLSRVEGIEEMEQLLGAGSILLHAGALEGQLVLPQLDRALRRLEELNAASSSSVVLGLGEAGRKTLSALSRSSEGITRFLLDLESSRGCDLDPSLVQILLPSPDPGESSLRAAYRAASGPKGLPSLLSGSLLEPGSRRPVVHVVAGVEDPWLALLPELLADLRAFLGFGARGRVVLHLVTKPFPRVGAGSRAALMELEREKIFDEAFEASANDGSMATRVAHFVTLSAVVPELLSRRPVEKERGAFSSYGIAPAPLASGDRESSSTYMKRFESAFQAAQPGSSSAGVALSELLSETVYYLHPPQAPPPDWAWKLCPEMIPVSASSLEPALCRIQRGLKLADLRLFA
jgi:hypothetical protein